MSQIEYYQIRAAMLPTWKYKDAAHLISGYNPEGSDFEISASSSHPISHAFFWLKSQVLKNQIATELILEKKFTKIHQRLHVSDIITAMKKDKFDCNKNMAKVLREIRANEPVTASVHIPIYIEAGKAMWKQQENLTADQVAECLLNLPIQIKTKYHVTLTTDITIIKIKDYLKGHSPTGKKGAKKLDDKVEPHIDWEQVLDSLG